MIANSVLDAALNKIAAATTVHLTKAAYTDLADVTGNSAASYAPTFTGPRDATRDIDDGQGGTITVQGRELIKDAGSDSEAEANADIATGGGYRYYVDATEIIYREPATGASIGDGAAVNDGSSAIFMQDPTFT